MASGPDQPERLRVALVGDRQRSWASLLGIAAIDVIPVSELSDVHGQDFGLIFAAVHPSEAASLIAAIEKDKGLPPTTLFIASNVDEHPQVRLMEILARAKREWVGTFDAIVDPVVLLDRNGLVVRANVGFARVVNRKVQEIAPLSFASLVGEAAEGQEDPVALSLADGQPRTEETRYSLLPGIQQVTTSPLRGADGENQGLVAILKDVADFKEQQERMLQAARLADIGLLAAGVAHEINTPLASIALRAESLLRSAEDARLQEIDSFKNFPRYLKTIDEEIFRCKKIISALLEFSRSRKPEVKEVDVNALAEKAADLVSHQMKLKQVALGLRLEPRLPTIEADDGQLRQAILVLLMNALDATSPGGHVEIETTRDGAGAVILSVIDDGPGIPKENLDKIFSPFFTTKPLGQGTGLGLAICHGVVSAHGGEIRVDSEVGRGTRFALVLPLHGHKEGAKDKKRRRERSALP